MIGIGNRTPLGIGLAVVLRDEFTARSQRIRAEMQALSGGSDALLRRNLSNLNEWGDRMLGVGTAMLAAQTYAAITASTFVKEMSTIQAVTGETKDQLVGLEKEIRRVGISSVFSLDETAKAATELAKAGFQTNEVKTMLQSIADLGAVAGIPIELAADAMGRVVNSYDLAATDVPAHANLIALAANKSAASVQEMLESLKYSADVTKALNIPFEETLAVFMRLSNAGLRGSVAGTSYANMLRYIAKAATEFRTGRQGQAMGMLGLTGQDMVNEQGQMKNTVELLNTFRKRLQQLDPIKAQAVMEAITSVRGQRAFQPLLALTDNRKDLEELWGILNDPNNGQYLGTASKEIMDNLWGDIERVKDSWKNLMVSVSENPMVRFIAKTLKAVLDITSYLISNPLGKYVIMPLVTLGGTFLVILGAIAKFKALLGNQILKDTFNFKKMGQSGAWAWDHARAAMLRYFTASRVMFSGRAFRYAPGTTDPNGNPIGGRFTPGSQAYNRRANNRRWYDNYGMGMDMGLRFNLSTIRGIYKRLGSLARPTLKALTFLGKFGTGLIGIVTSILDLAGGQLFAGLGGLIGTVGGFLLGGPLGAAIGGMALSGIGSLFDTQADAKEVSMPTNQQGQRLDYSDLQNSGALRPQTIIVNMDGKKALQKEINDSNDAIFNLENY